MMANSNWVQFALDRQMTSEPGTTFCYDSAGMHLLSAIRQKATGLTAVLATDDIRSQFDYQNLSPKPLLTTEPLIPAQLPAAQVPAIQNMLLGRFSLGVITHVNLSRSALRALWTVPLLRLDPLFRRWTSPVARPALVRDSLSDLARPKGQLILEKAMRRQQWIILQRQVKRPHL